MRFQLPFEKGQKPHLELKFQLLSVLSRSFILLELQLCFFLRLTIELDTQTHQFGQEVKNYTYFELSKAYICLSLHFLYLQVRLNSKIVNQKPIVKAQNQDSKLDISLEFLNGMTYELKVEYLALNGWSLHLERYKGVYFEVAQKYMNRRKYRIYLKELVGMPNYDDYTKTDILKVKNMTSLVEKKIYLFQRGWSVKVLTRGFQEYEYAVRYFNRKKKHIYLTPYEPNETKIFLK